MLEFQPAIRYCRKKSIFELQFSEKWAHLKHRLILKLQVTAVVGMMHCSQAPGGWRSIQWPDRDRYSRWISNISKSVPSPKRTPRPWKRVVGRLVSFFLGWPIFREYVRFREEINEWGWDHTPTTLHLLVACFGFCIYHQFVWIRVVSCSSQYPLTYRSVFECDGVLEYNTLWYATFDTYDVYLYMYKLVIWYNRI